MKRLLVAFMAVCMLLFGGCGQQPSDTITVVSREDGSGTRGAFVDLLGIRAPQDNGASVDQTTLEAVFTNSTAVVMLTVAGDKNAIGYMSVGSLNDSVNSVAVDGVLPTTDHIREGLYPISRPFVVITQAEGSPLVQDFMRFLFSAEGQSIVQAARYVPVALGDAFVSDGSVGTITVGGSSSVAPLMEKLIEGYAVFNPHATVELQASDSTTGILSVADGTYDIGMSSRVLREAEMTASIHSREMAYDGIAVVVHPDNPIEELSGEEVRRIFTGDITAWSSLG